MVKIEKILSSLQKYWSIESLNRDNQAGELRQDLQKILIWTESSDLYSQGKLTEIVYLLQNLRQYLETEGITLEDLEKLFAEGKKLEIKEMDVAERPELESRVLTSEQLKVLLRDLDESLADKGKTNEAIAKTAAKYKIGDGGKKLLADAIARQKEIAAELKANSIRQGKPEAEAQKIADKESGKQLMVEVRLREETKKPAREVRELAREIVEVSARLELKKEEVKSRFEDPVVAEVAQDVAAEVRIEAELGKEVGPYLTRLAVEEEEKLRKDLGEKSEEIVAKIVKTGEVGELVAEAKVINDLEMMAGVARMEEQMEAKVKEVTARLAEVLEVRSEEGVERIRQIIDERVRGKISGEIVTLNQPTISPTSQERVRMPTMVDELDGVVEGGIPTDKAEQANSVLRDINTGLEQYQNQYKKVLGGWQETLVKWKVFDTVVVANPETSVAVAEKFAGEVAEVYGPNSGVLETERQTWREANLAGQINPLHEAYLNTITSLVRSPISIQNRLQSFEGAEGIDTRGEMMAQAYQGVMGLMEDPEIANKFESARRIYQMTKGVQSWLTGRMADIPALGNFAKSLSADLGGFGYAERALGVLKNSKTLVEATKGILGLVGGSGAGGVVASGAAALGLSATGVGAVVVAVAALGKVAGWLGGKIRDFFSSLGIDLPDIGGLIGGIGGFLGLKGGLLKGVPALLGKAGILGANFAAGLMTAISGALAGLAIPSVVVWGPIVGVLVFVLIIIGPLISAMVPPGRGVGGAVVDQTTLNGGYLAAPPWNGDINDLPDSCPPDSLPIGGTVTQGPLAKDCSHALYKNVIDVAGGYGDNITSTHDGVVEAVINMGDGYGQYVDIRGRCGTTTFVTRYAHMVVNSQSVATGQKVTKGTTIGRRNSSGNSSGDHLHYEIRGLTTDYFKNWEGCCISNDTACTN